MQEDKEKLLQQLLDSNKHLNHPPTLADQEDFIAYRVLYNGLTQEPEGGLSFSFKSKVLNQIKLEKARANDIKLYLITGLVVLIGLIAMVLLVFCYSDVFLKYAHITIKIAVLIGAAAISLTAFQFFEEKHIKSEK